MTKESAGILLYRRGGSGDIELLIVHPGGPFWTGRDSGAWSIPKGEFDAGSETAEAAARREFNEETGHRAEGALHVLTPVRLRSGKTVHAFACEGTFDPATLVSNTFELEWPRGSGKRRSFPEVDMAAWCTPEVARQKLNPAQAAFVDDLLRLLSGKN